MGSTAWSYLVGDALTSARVASGNVLLDWDQFAASGLVLYHLNEGSGTAVADSSGNGNNATLSAANWNASPWMGASAMGASATLTPGTVPALGTGDWTMELWLYLASNPQNSAASYFCRADGPSDQRAWIYLVYRTDGTIAWCYRAVDNAGHTSGWPEWWSTVGIGTWTHLALVCDGATIRFYHNGVQRLSNSITGWTFSPWTSRSWVTDAYSGLDELRDSATAVYPNGTTFYPIRYPASGTWTVAAARAENNILPGVLTMTLSEALPTGTSLKAKLLSTVGGDTDWQTLSGSGTTYTYDFTGQAGANWYPGGQLFAGGTLNANTPTVVDADLAWEAEYLYGTGSLTGESSLSGASQVVSIEQGTGQLDGVSDLSGDRTVVSIEQGTGSLGGTSELSSPGGTAYDETTQPTPDASDYRSYHHDRSRYGVQSWRVSEGRCLPWLTQDPPADFITRGIWHGLIADFTDIAAAGFNTVVCPTETALSQEIAALVAAATTAGVKVVPILRATPQVADVAAYDADPAVAGWYVLDEPSDEVIWATKLAKFQGYKTDWAATQPLIAGLSEVATDAYRDRWMAFAAESGLVVHNNYLYRFDLWPFALTFDSTTGLAANLPLAQAIAEAQAKQQWVVCQAYGETGATGEACQPSEDFLRAQVYLALISGATGYAHFALDSQYLRSENMYGIALNPPTAYDVQTHESTLRTGTLVDTILGTDDSLITPLVTFTFESLPWPADAITMLSAQGVVGTFYVFTHVACYPFGGLSAEFAAQCLALQSAGWDIGSHSDTHPDFRTLTEAQMITEFEVTNAELEEEGLTPIDNFSWPYGDYNEATMEVASRYYRSARSIDLALNSVPVRNYALYAIAASNMTDGELGSIQSTSLLRMKWWVDLAVTNRQWALFYIHTNQMDATQIAYLSELIDYVQAAGVDILTVSEALDILDEAVGHNVALAWSYNTLGDNCKVRLKMDEPAWSTQPYTILDDSGNAHHASKGSTPSQTTDGWLNRAASYPGDNLAERIWLDDHADWDQDEFTVQAWLKWDGVTSEEEYYSRMCAWMHGNARTTCAFGLLYRRQAATQSILVYHNGAAVITYTAALPTDYHHCAVTYSRSNSRMRLWLNGVMVAEATYNEATDANTAVLWIGREGTIYPWSGEIDAFQFDAEELYTDTFYPVRHPASGTWEELSSQADCQPGLLTVTLAEALPAGTSIQAKMLSAAGDDTGWQTLTGSGTTYTYDFTGQVVGDWKAALKLIASGDLNANSPEVFSLEWAYTDLSISDAQRAEAVLLWRAADTLNAEVLARESEWLSRSSALDIRVDYIPTFWSWSDNPIRYGCRGAGPYWLTLVNIEAFEHSVRVTLPFTPSSISRDFGPTESQTGPTFTLTLPAWGTWGAEITE